MTDLGGGLLVLIRHLGHIKSLWDKDATVLSTALQSAVAELPAAVAKFDSSNPPDQGTADDGVQAVAGICNGFKELDKANWEGQDSTLCPALLNQGLLKNSNEEDRKLYLDVSQGDGDRRKNFLEALRNCSLKELSRKTHAGQDADSVFVAFAQQLLGSRYDRKCASDVLLALRIAAYTVMAQEEGVFFKQDGLLTNMCEALKKHTDIERITREDLEAQAPKAYLEALELSCSDPTAKHSAGGDWLVIQALRVATGRSAILVLQQPEAAPSFVRFAPQLVTDAAGMTCLLTFAAGRFMPLTTIPGNKWTTTTATVMTPSKRFVTYAPKKIQCRRDLQVDVEFKIGGQPVVMRHTMRPLRDLRQGEDEITLYPMDVDHNDGGPKYEWGVRDLGGPKYVIVKVAREGADGKSNFGNTGATHVTEIGKWIPKPEFDECFRTTWDIVDIEVPTEVCAPTLSLV